jgi:hypothetical protein
MSRSFTRIIGIVALNTALYSQAAVIEMTSLSREAVANAIASAAPGDRIVLPSGSATWDGPMVITKSIALMGAGIDLTTITANFTNAQEAMISFRPDSAARTADLPFRVSGFTFNADFKANGIQIYNESGTPITKVRIDHNRVLNAGGESAGRAVYIRGSVYGVADNNTIEGYRHGMDGEGINFAQWDNLPIEVGTAKNFYFEDNLLLSTGPDVFHAGGHGGRYVARYNQYKNLSSGNIFPVFDMHGNQPPDLPGEMVVEIYGNDIDLGTKGGRIIDQRGGTLMAFFNRIKWGSDGATIVIREEFLDSNYPPGNNYVMHVTGSYYWNNRANETPISDIGVISNQYEDTYDLAQNVDFWFDNPLYNGTTQRGIFVGTQLPATCTVGDGAWITTQSLTNLDGMVGRNPTNRLTGTFYKCTAPNVWTKFYTPYVYPHPLRGNLNAPAPPTNLRIVGGN